VVQWLWKGDQSIMDGWALPDIDMSRCTGCGACVTNCPTRAVGMVAQRPRIVRPADCTYCTDCEVACPEGAIICTFVVAWG